MAIPETRPLEGSAKGPSPHDTPTLSTLPLAASPTKAQTRQTRPSARHANTMFEPRVMQQHFPPQPTQDSTFESPEFPGTPQAPGTRTNIVIRPSGRPGFTAPKAATLFLGKDHERWRRDERDKWGLGLGWGRIASAVSSQSDRGSSMGAFSAYSSGSEGEITDEEASLSGQSSRSRSFRNSHGRHSRRPSEAFSPLLTPIDGKSSRLRRYSSNGPEAAFQRHETVIGIHTPQRRSSAASDNHPALRPLAQIRQSEVEEGKAAERPKTRKKIKDRAARKAQADLAKRKVKDVVHETMDLDDAARPTLRRLRSNLEEAAAAAAASSLLPDDDDAEGVDFLRSTLSDAVLDGEGPMGATDLRASLVKRQAKTLQQGRALSPRAPPLKLAKRRTPEAVEGTLYDKSGPHREGAVTDSLSVRLFSSEDKERHNSFDDHDLSNPERPVTEPWGRRGSNSSYDDHDALYMRSSRLLSSAGASSSPRRGSMNYDASGEIEEEEGGDASYHAAKPMVYLITTPDNRVSSAAKLRRWAMDGDGNFYAAMEIKSIEAKLRAADPAVGPATKELARELKESYLEDILDEVQKAETLNPTRTGAISKLLKTEDDRYVRLEEDYPEEAFFVIAGCEEEEIYPVLVYIFVQAIRALANFHAQGWMHGDVKLENLMFDENGELVVIDYENANPYHGIPGGDGTVQLVSYDWIPPEACPGPMGRRMGPSGDLWALGCNLIRAFALRDGIDDLSIREVLLGDGQQRFLDWTAKLSRPGKPIDLEPTFANDYAKDFCDSISQVSRESSTTESSAATSHAESDSLLPSPAQMLYRFARLAPELLDFVITRCVVADTARRGPDAEVEGLRLASWFEKQDLMETGKKAVDQAIQLSGSVWVRPRLDEARRSLGLD